MLTILILLIQLFKMVIKSCVHSPSYHLLSSGHKQQTSKAIINIPNLDMKIPRMSAKD